MATRAIKLFIRTFALPLVCVSQSIVLATAASPDTGSSSSLFHWSSYEYSSLESKLPRKAQGIDLMNATSSTISFFFLGPSIGMAQSLFFPMKMAASMKNIVDSAKENFSSRSSCR
jgi:hypothetical protein